MTPRPCPEMEGRLVDLAVGHLSGDEREEVVAHLERCAGCSAEVAALSAAGDDLLGLAPEAEPPATFEARVFAKLGFSGLAPAGGGPAGLGGRRRSSGGQARARRSLRSSRGMRWAWPAAVAAAVAVLVGTGVGSYSLGHSQGHHARTEAMSGPLLSGRQQVGKVMLYPGHTTWLFMYLDAGSITGSVRCEVVARDGRTMTVGHFWATSGSEAWGARVPVPASQVSEAMVVGPGGHVMAVARLA